MSTQDFDEKLAELHDRAPLLYYLGEFALVFSALEKFYHLAFDELSGFDRKLARTLAGNKRLPELISLLTSIYPLRQSDPEYLSEFKLLNQQIDDLSKFRNALIHVGVGGRDPELFSVNPMAAKTAETIKILRFQLTDIKNAISDVNRVVRRLRLLASPNFPIMHLSDEEQELYAPWRYKRIEPTPLDSQPH